MKRKISVTIEEDILGKVDEHIDSGNFRNKSHFFEFAIKRLLEK